MLASTGQRRTPLGHGYADAARPGPFARGDAQDALRHAIGPEGGIVVYDLTGAGRFGIKGKGAAAWLDGAGLAVPPRVNTMVTTWRGLDLVRLGTEDFLLLPSAGSEAGALADLRALWADATGRKGFDSWRDEVWAWFHLCGEGLARFMAKTCPVDLRSTAFPVRHVAQTRVAQMDCIIVRSDRNQEPGFDLFFDVASSDYMLRSLQLVGAEE